MVCVLAVCFVCVCVCLNKYQKIYILLNCVHLSCNQIVLAQSISEHRSHRGEVEKFSSAISSLCVFFFPVVSINSCDLVIFLRHLLSPASVLSRNIIPLCIFSCSASRSSCMAFCVSCVTFHHVTCGDSLSSDVS